MSNNRYYGHSTLNVTGFLTDWKQGKDGDTSDNYGILSIGEQFRPGSDRDAKNETVFHSVMISGDVYTRFQKMLRGSSPKGYLVNAVLGDPTMNMVLRKGTEDVFDKYVSWKLLSFSLAGGGKKKDGTNSDEPSAPKSKPADRSPAFDDDIPF